MRKDKVNEFLVKEFKKNTILLEWCKDEKENEEHNGNLMIGSIRESQAHVFLGKCEEVVYLYSVVNKIDLEEAYKILGKKCEK